MAIVTCPNCGRSVNSAFGGCLNCSAQVMPSSSAPRAATGALEVVMTLIFGAALIGGAFALFAPDSAEEIAEAREAACQNTTRAFVMSQQFVKRQLKSPASAEFPYITAPGVKVAYRGNCEHRITAYVDAQNSFGATLRQPYLADLRYNKADDSWSAIDVALQ